MISNSSNHISELNHSFELVCSSMLMLISIPAILATVGTVDTLPSESRLARQQYTPRIFRLFFNAGRISAWLASLELKGQSTHSTHSSTHPIHH